MTEVQQLEAIYRRIRREDQWAQGRLKRRSLYGDQLCLVGATREVLLGDAEATNTNDSAQMEMVLYQEAQRRGFASATLLNDRSTHRYVLGFLRELIRDAKRRERQAIRARRLEEQTKNMNTGRDRELHHPTERLAQQPRLRSSDDWQAFGVGSPSRLGEGEWADPAWTRGGSHVQQSRLREPEPHASGHAPTKSAGGRHLAREERSKDTLHQRTPV